MRSTPSSPYFQAYHNFATVLISSISCEFTYKSYSCFDLLPISDRGHLGLMLIIYLQYFVHAQSCPTLCNPMDCIPPGSAVPVIFQTRTLEWVVVSSSRGSFQPRDQACVSCISCNGRGILYHQRHLRQGSMGDLYCSQSMFSEKKRFTTNFFLDWGFEQL